MLRLLLLIATILTLVSAEAALGNTAADALNAPYQSSDLFRPAGSPGDIWNTPIPADQPVDPNSTAMTQGLARSIGINPDGSWVNPPYGQPLGLRWRSDYYVYVVDRDTPLKTVCSRFVLDGTSWSWNRSFHEVLMKDKVPIPTGRLYYDGGGDHSAAILDPATDTYYEFFVGPDPVDPAAPKKDPQGRDCDYLTSGGGRQLLIGTRLGNVTLPWWMVSPGYFRNDQPFEDMSWGRQATGAMPVIGGLVTPDEWSNPSATTGFGHALSVVVPWAKCGTHYWPSVRNDCGGPCPYCGYVPEGALLRFAPDTNCGVWDGGIAATTDPLRKLYLSRIRGLCVTIQKYGMRVVDQTGSGMAWKQRSGPIAPDAAATYNGGQHWPNDYWDAMRGYLGTKLQVMAESPHPPQWTRPTS
jgi:hypothetical protein